MTTPNNLSPPPLLPLSHNLLTQIKSHLSSPTSPTLLPSYTHTLPTGLESGEAVAVDLGGSTLRVGLISITSGRITILSRRQWRITESIKQLSGTEFFDWVAARIHDIVGEGDVHRERDVGVTWSFPIIQTSEGSGLLQPMGKGFRVFDTLGGKDFRSEFEGALRRKGLKGLRLTALVNDTTATLLAHAYGNPKTRLGLICGTGLNIALPLPVSMLSAEKFGDRPREWWKKARQVVINTECSMFGKGILKLTKADRELDREVERPGFQPWEYVTGGRYLGEIVRLVLKERGLNVGGEWTLGTDVVAGFERDETVDNAVQALKESYGTSLSAEDVDFVKQVCRAVARRAAAYLATMVFTLCQLLENREETVIVACCGAVLEKHPSIRRQCQGFLDELAGAGKIVLEVAEDSGLLGAAVAAIVSTERGVRSARSKL